MPRPKKEDATAKGVADSWDFWLEQHPVSVPEIIEEAVEKAFTKWLDAHADEIVAAIAKRHGQPRRHK